MDPIQIFRDWLEEAKAHPHITEPTAMTVASVSHEHKPSARIVLLRDIIDDTFIFYTNYESRKSRELINGHAALCFYWMPLDKQVRVEGTIEKVSPELSDAYFAKRGREKQIGAWASIQSDPMQARDDLEDRIAAFTKKFKDTDPIPRPPHWGGWRVVPTHIELWEQRDYRLHVRNHYIKQANGDWQHQLLYP
jgi:pyridoxamine 5'-phosphate oxidase